ncbi:hypothetical protein EV363DRAFT_1173837 [Boletus edulis]|nr:hypothetical protein EV363DRAFT_1173837 [Boletus edulis]
MSSDIQSALELIVLNNYLSPFRITIVTSKPVLTFSQEIEYIWCRPWTWVSTMFVVVRYIGLCWVIVLFLIYGSAFVVFHSAVDLVMILRVYAMWNRSRMILYILLFIFVLQTIIIVVLDGSYDNPSTHFPVTVAQVLDFSFCKLSYINTPSTLFVYRIAPRFVLSAALVIFAVSQTLKQSFEMYKATKQWQPNRYMQKLVGDGIIYFIVYVLISLYPSCPSTFACAPDTSILLQILTMKMFAPTYRNVLYQVFGVLRPSNDIATIPLTILLLITFYTLIPRFIIGIRELYACDIRRGRFHIDTGFGMQSRSNAGLDTTVSAIVFMDGHQGPEVEGDTDNSGDLELGRVHASGLYEDSPIGGRGVGSMGERSESRG